MDEKEELMKQIEELNSELEKLRSGASEEEKTVNAFLEEFPLAENFLDEINEIVSEKQELCGHDGLKTALISVLIDKYRSPEQLSADEEFLNKFIFNNKSVRERVINEYLDSVSKTPDACVKRSGLPLTKPEKPSTVRAAGELARALFRK